MKNLNFIVLIFTFIIVGCDNQTNTKNQSSNSNDSLIQQAEQFAQLHNEGLEFILEYPDLDSINLYQRVELSKTFCLINDIESFTEFSPQDIHTFFDNYDLDNSTNLVNQLFNNGKIDQVTKDYLIEAINITENSNSFEQKILDLSNLQVIINNNENISNESKINSLFSITVLKKSAQFWNDLPTQLTTLKNPACNNCLKSNLWKIGLLDGVGVIAGIFGGPGVSVATALAVSITVSCRFCNMCSGCGGQDPWNPVLCNNCPAPSKFDGASCYFGKPTTGNGFIMNGNFYWPSNAGSCSLPIWSGFFTQGTWDGAHCYYKIPNGAQAFIYKNGFYIKCVK